MLTPMTPEFCATCGCGELAHHFLRGACEDDCPPDCERLHPDRYECDCGACDDYVWMEEEAQDLVCICGCPEDDHVDAEDICDGCEDCRGFEEWGTALDRLRAGLRSRGREWPEPAAAPPLPPGKIRLNWFDQPVEVIGALVVGPNGDPVRVQGPPAGDAAVYLYFAVTDDGLEIAVSRDEF
jgi:hypothetical protein